VLVNHYVIVIAAASSNPTGNNETVKPGLCYIYEIQVVSHITSCQLATLEVVGRANSAVKI